MSRTIFIGRPIYRVRIHPPTCRAIRQNLPNCASRSSQKLFSKYLLSQHRSTCTSARTKEDKPLESKRPRKASTNIQPSRKLQRSIAVRELILDKLANHSSDHAATSTEIKDFVRAKDRILSLGYRTVEHLDRTVWLWLRAAEPRYPSEVPWMRWGVSTDPYRPVIYKLKRERTAGEQPKAQRRKNLTLTQVQWEGKIARVMLASGGTCTYADLMQAIPALIEQDIDAQRTLKYKSQQLRFETILRTAVAGSGVSPKFETKEQRGWVAQYGPRSGVKLEELVKRAADEIEALSQSDVARASEDVS